MLEMFFLEFIRNHPVPLLYLYEWTLLFPSQEHAFTHPKNKPSRASLKIALYSSGLSFWRHTSKNRNWHDLAPPHLSNMESPRDETRQWWIWNIDICKGISIIGPSTENIWNRDSFFLWCWDRYQCGCYISVLFLVFC